MITANDIWERIWWKSMALAKSYHNWKAEGRQGSVSAFSKRKTELYNEVAKILKDIQQQTQRGMKK